MNVSALRGLALPLAVAAAVVLPATAASAAPVPTVTSTPAENPYCDPRSGYGCEAYGYQPGYYPRDHDTYYRHWHRHHHHHWRY
ncbi:MAG TPA: hypothetical protein VGJ14_13720 [Sporichthyaceae bacterium]|jgi:hypothetical protein